jgi:predicted transcriptional regulator
LKVRRSKLELILDVLEAVMNDTEKPTRIMYEANLSWTILNEILSSLVSQSLLEEIDTSRSRDRRNNRVYKITKKGETVVRFYRNAEKLLKTDESSLPTR